MKDERREHQKKEKNKLIILFLFLLLFTSSFVAVTKVFAQSSNTLFDLEIEREDVDDEEDEQNTDTNGNSSRLVVDADERVENSEASFPETGEKSSNGLFFLGGTLLMVVVIFVGWEWIQRREESER